MAVFDNVGRRAVTRCRNEIVYKDFATKLDCWLETGRTHQIRVHLSHIGYPLIGDPIYGGRLRFPKKAKQDLKDALKAFKRQALHSKKLTLKHPDTGESMTWKVDLPDDMKRLLNVLSRLNSN
jgi:23S rRNA pseudouridine1911/1915/1917 synthase